MEYVVYVIIIIVFILLIRKIKELKTIISNNENQILRLKNENNKIISDFLKIKIKTVESKLNEFNDKVSYEDAVNMIILRIQARYPDNYIDKQKRAIRLLNSCLRDPQLIPEFIYMMPTTCSRNFIEPIITNIEDSTFSLNFLLDNNSNLPLH